MEADFNRKTDSSSIIVIKYYDKLLSYDEEEQLHLAYRERHSNCKIRGCQHNRNYNTNYLKRRRENWVDDQYKCIKKYKKHFNTDIFHLLRK
ncbi:MAG: hypothetical protein KDD03_04205, partial [Gelidibacter sp.]|nr:hypothetical protein [Gelidibacter sp.]